MNKFFCVLSIIFVTSLYGAQDNECRLYDILHGGAEENLPAKEHLSEVAKIILKDHKIIDSKDLFGRTPLFVARATNNLRYMIFYC